MLKLYKRTIIVSIWIFAVFLISSIILRILVPDNDTISFLQNYIIGITCSILVVIITTILQYKSEYERIMSDLISTLRRLILSLSVALFYQEENVEEVYCREIIEKIKDECDKLNQLNQTFYCFSKKNRQKHNELVKIFIKLYIPLLDSSKHSYYDMLNEKIDYSTYIKLAQKTKEFIDDNINKKMIDELIKGAQQSLEEQKRIKNKQTTKQKV